MVQFLEYRPRALPNLACGTQVPAGLAGIAERGEHVRLVVAVAGARDQVQRAPVARDGLRVVAQAMVDPAEGLPDRRLGVVVADLLVAGQRLPAMVACLLEVSEPGAVPRHVGQGPSLADMVAGRGEAVERFGGVIACGRV